MHSRVVRSSARARTCITLFCNIKYQRRYIIVRVYETRARVYVLLNANVHYKCLHWRIDRVMVLKQPLGVWQNRNT